MRSGFVALVGRPNVGKSTLVNALLGTKVSIVSNKVQTTRKNVRCILHAEDTQIVFVDTPGIHKPRSELGVRANAHAYDALADTDIVVQLIDATQPIGAGDEFVFEKIHGRRVIVVNKIDRVSPDELLMQLDILRNFDADAYFPVSAKTGEGIAALSAYLMESMPEGPPYFPEDMVREAPDEVHVAELVREALLAVLEDELPHALTCLVTEWEWPRVRVVIYVERDSQKGIVIGRGGEVLKRVGERVRAQMEPGAYLELFVKVEKDWTRRPQSLSRLGF